MRGRELDRACAGLFCVGFRGTTPSAEVLELVRRGVYGVILFARNVENATQVAELSGTLKRAAGRPFLVTVDQEGGRVARLRAPQGFSELPTMRAVGETGSEEVAWSVGARIGRELRAVGVDQDYAPVVDVDSNPANPVIGDRSFGRDPELVGRLGSALARGLQSEGVAACAKHFPGHGDTSQDSHRQLPRLSHGLARLEAVELPPFRALAAAGVASVMTAHVVFEALDPERPATLSAPVMRLLRERCGFLGPAISDDLEMKAISEHFPLEQVVPDTILAGVDGFLVCHSAEKQAAAIELLRKAIESGRVERARVEQAAARLERLLRFAGGPPDLHMVERRLAEAKGVEVAERPPSSGAGRDPTAS